MQVDAGKDRTKAEHITSLSRRELDVSISATRGRGALQNALNSYKKTIENHVGLRRLPRFREE